MKFAVLVPAFLLPVVTLAQGFAPSALRADDGSDLTFFLKRYDGPVAVFRRATNGKRHTVPRTLQVEEVPVRRAVGLVERQQCVDPGYVPCAAYAQCCPAGATCGPGTCCPAGSLQCTGQCCKDIKGDCCPNVGCCPSGQVCFTALNGEIGCCPRGKRCTTISGCADPGYLECPGESFCCPPTATCGRDASGSATCLSSGDPNYTPNVTPNITPNITLDITYPPTVTPTISYTDGGNDPNTIAAVTSTKSKTTTSTNTDNPFTNINPFRNAARPQVAGASGLMLAAAFLGAFLL